MPSNAVRASGRGDVQPNAVVLATEERRRLTLFARWRRREALRRALFTEVGRVAALFSAAQDLAPTFSSASAASGTCGGAAAGLAALALVRDELFQVIGGGVVRGPFFPKGAHDHLHERSHLGYAAHHLLNLRHRGQNAVKAAQAVNEAFNLSQIGERECAAFGRGYGFSKLGCCSWDDSLGLRLHGLNRLQRRLKLWNRIFMEKAGYAGLMVNGGAELALPLAAAAMLELLRLLSMRVAGILRIAAGIIAIVHADHPFIFYSRIAVLYGGVLCQRGMKGDIQSRPLVKRGLLRQSGGEAVYT
ncbi:hypothetical protein SAMN04487969_10587 [Paenibacillus algorifonticola]|uniref:Uncharacterized protein n=1 Tax=Paenibacillus algorifonticola TaxID=684063 RepID=A0A1I2CHZ8_9BACL|nr:hypothetical protein SAMN04487969_10587 [Paenibacillus algorifonticola]